MPPGHMSSVQPSEVVCLPPEPQSHNEAQDLLLLQDYVHRLTNTLRTDIRTACCCIRSLRIRVEARANVTEREVISRQLQLMHASVQHYRTEDLNTADTSCLSRTSFEHFEDRPGPWAEKNARIPTPR